QLAIETFPLTDNGIWEIEAEPKHYLFSKMMCWAAVDRGTKIAYQLKKNTSWRAWSKVRNHMKAEILTQGWNPEVGAFTQYYGSSDLDASTLLMSHLDLIDPKDPRMVSTVLKSEEKLLVNGLMFRYTNRDDHGFPENAFTICTFWLIDAL